MMSDLVLGVLYHCTFPPCSQFMQSVLFTSRLAELRSVKLTSPTAATTETSVAAVARFVAMIRSRWLLAQREFRPIACAPQGLMVAARRACVLWSSLQLSTRRVLRPGNN